ncbi:Sucrose-phosphate synthase [Artemisia annua]|uniref:Sucrose-phosphate synthase n=1 Tax=Artemisia annua TaxID=35608 RepID=A0A2U1QEP0_ARTAN|nr:Sucrose-phosphate synthase [Artemisia annua]
MWSTTFVVCIINFTTQAIDVKLSIMLFCRICCWKLNLWHEYLSFAVKKDNSLGGGFLNASKISPYLVIFPETRPHVSTVTTLATIQKGVFINPAFIEPFGLTLIKAAGYGLPMLATKNGGPVDIKKLTDLRVFGPAYPHSFFWGKLQVAPFIWSSVKWVKAQTQRLTQNLKCVVCKSSHKIILMYQ